MSSLHTVNKSPQSGNAIRDCLRAGQPGDAVLLIEDGVYAAAGGDVVRQFQQRGLRLYALHGDVAARGLERHLADGVELVDDAGFVGLCCEYRTVCSWY